MTLRHGFDLLAQGSPVSPARLARRSGASTAEVVAALRASPAGIDGRGHLTELFGLMLAPTDHRIVFDGGELFACCALVAHAAPMLIRRDVAVTSVDPVGGAAVRLELRRDAIVEVSPVTAVATFPETPTGSARDNVRAAFCSHVRHFVAAGTAEQFAAQDPRRLVVSTADMHALAAEVAGRIWLAPR